MVRFPFGRLLCFGVVLGCAALGFTACGDSSGGGSGLPNGAATRAQVLRGRYLVTSSGCADCHNRNSDDPNDPMWLAGYTPGTPGQPFEVGPFKTYPANLTPDVETGLGSWSTQDIFNALRNGMDDEGAFLAPPMPWPAARNFTDDDIWAIVAYLQNIKPVHNAVPASEGPIVNGKVDWSAAYAGLKPLPSYPAGNEVDVP